MICKINKLKAHNFMSFEDFELNFSRYSGFTFISGRNEFPNDSASSNGVGKSSIEEAIIWSLTGNTLRGTKDVKRFNSEDICSVEIELTIDDDDYRIIRSKDRTNLQVFVNDEDISGKGIRDTEKILQERLPDLTTSLIGSVIILGQGLPQRLTNNTPSGRKEVLEQLSKSDFMIEDLKNRIAKRKNYLLSENRKIDDELLKLNTSFDLKCKQLQDYENKLNSLENKQALQDRYDSLLAESNNIKKEISEVDEDKYSNEYQERIDKINALDVGYKEDELRIKEVYLNKSKINEIRLSSISANISNLKKDITKKKSITDICPTCGQKLIGVIKPDTSNEEAELSKLQKDYNILKEGIDKLNKERDNKLYVLNGTYKMNRTYEENKKKEAISILNELKIKRQDLEAKFNSVNSEIQIILNELSNIDFTKNNLINDINNITIEIQTIESNLLYNNNDKDNIKKHIDVINKMETSIKRDFRGYLLSNIINYINERCKEYSLDIFNNRNIEFKLDGNNISISYSGKEYENLSGGERQKIDLIVQLSIRDMLCTYLNFSCNILMLDEITDNLDSVGCSNTINLITNKLVDIENIFIISHHQDIQIPYDNEILIRKNEDGVSEIV